MNLSKITDVFMSVIYDLDIVLMLSLIAVAAILARIIWLEESDDK